MLHTVQGIEPTVPVASTQQSEPKGHSLYSSIGKHQYWNGLIFSYIILLYFHRLLLLNPQIP